MVINNFKICYKENLSRLTCNLIIYFITV